MKIIKSLSFLMGAVLLTLACGVFDFPAPSVEVPPKTLTVVPSATLLSMQTPTATHVFLFPTPQASPYPSWVADFSDPILVKLDGQQPDYKDDFSNQNKGWFYFIPEIGRRPFYALMEDDALQLKLSAENNNRDSWVYSPLLIRKDFVLSFDFRFKETQPGDLARFEFSQSAEQSVALDLFKNQTWVIHWGTHDNWQSATGVYEYFAPERITILIIMRGEECAVYLNDAPLTYLSNCRTGSIIRSSPWAVTFHVIAEPGHNAAITMDNMKLWDLNKIPDIP